LTPWASKEAYRVVDSPQWLGKGLQQEEVTQERLEGEYSFVYAIRIELSLL